MKLDLVTTVACLLALGVLAADVDAQRGRSSGSASRGSISRGGGSFSRPSPSFGRSGGSIGRSTSFGRSGGSIGRGSYRSGGTSTRSRGTTILGRSGSGSVSIGGSSRGRTITIPRTSSGTTYRSGGATRYTPGAPSAGSSRVARPSGSDLYRGRAFDGRTASPAPSSPADTPAGLRPAPGATPDATRYAPAAPRTPSFPRAYRPSQYSPESYTPGARAGGSLDAGPSARRGRTVTPRVPRDVRDIAARYAGGSSADRGGTRSSGSARGDRGGVAGIGPAGGRGGAADGSAGGTFDRGGSAERGDAGSTGRGGRTRGSSPGGYAAGPGGRLSSDLGGGLRGDVNAGGGGTPGIVARGRDALSPNGNRPASDNVGGGVTPGGTGGGGYVTPTGPPVVATPTISNVFHGGYGYGFGFGYPYCGPGFYFNGCYPGYWWSWYAWCSPFYSTFGFFNWAFPRDRYVYVQSPANIVIYAADDYAYAPAGAGPVVVEEPPRAVTQAGDPAPRTLELDVAAERYLDLGDRAFRESRYGDAVHFYARAVELSDGEGVLYLVLADALFATGDYHYAAYVVRKAFELDPTLIENPVDKHGFYSDPSEFDRQLDVLERYVRDHPTDTDARLVLALNMLFGARPGDALDVLDSPYSRPLGTDPAAELVRAGAERLLGR